MTAYNKQTLGTFFETGDVPQGSDYQNLIDSQVNIVETSVQSMGGALATTELVTPRVSATNVNVTGTLSVTTYAAVNGSFSGTVSANALNIATDISAAAGTIYSNANRVTGGVYRTPTVVSAAGSTQATAALLGSNGVIRCKGIVDGQTTGFLLLANQTGNQQTIWVEENTSCNLWPCLGGQINALSSNAAFAMTGNTQYIVTHIKASGYSVK